MNMIDDRWTKGLAWALLGLGFASGALARPAPAHKSTDEANEVKYLVARGTADSLATASLLSRLGDDHVDPDQLIAKALTLAPDRPELVWLQLRSCEITHCPDEATIATRLKTLDPDNGLAWLTDLRIAEYKSPVEVTQALRAIGKSDYPQLYWNKLIVLMYDSLTHPPGSARATALTQNPDDRLSHVIGVLSAFDVPAFVPLARECGSDQFAEPDRRTVCESIANRLETSDSVIAQNVSNTLERSIMAVGGASQEAFRTKVAQERYMTVASNRLRPGSEDADAERRVASMRRLAREQDVEAAMLGAFHEPLERPPGWEPPQPPEHP